MVSSLEDRRDMSKPAQDSGPMRKSLESRSTSVWGTPTEKGLKSGQCHFNADECFTASRGLHRRTC